MCYAHVLHQSQICLRYIVFPVVCAGPEQAVCLRVKTESRRGNKFSRQTHFGGGWPPYLDPSVCNSQKGILNIGYLIQHYYATKTGLAASELGTCARWTMWNAWVILAVRCYHAQHPDAVIVNDLIICQVFSVYNTGPLIVLQ